MLRLHVGEQLSQRVKCQTAKFSNVLRLSSAFLRHCKYRPTFCSLLSKPCEVRLEEECSTVVEHTVDVCLCSVLSLLS